MTRETVATEQPTMAATLTRMERDRVLVKRPTPRDGRSMLYSLSPEALEKTADIRAAVDAVNREALMGLKENERASYLAIMAKVSGALEASLEETSD